MADIQEDVVDVHLDQINNAKSGKKKRENRDQWKKQKIKQSRATGQEHVNHVGKIIPERSTLNMVCRCNCGEKLSEVEKTQVLKSFNEMADHQKQNIYMRGCIRRKDDNHIRRRGQNTNREVRSSFQYFIPVGSSQIKVCKASYCALHGVKEARLKKKVLNFTETLQDHRGRHGNHKKLDENIRVSIRQHISSFPARESHYSRSDNRQRTYLDSNLSVAEMYRMFQQKYPEYNDQRLEWVYRDIFNYEFNISFGFPRTDICDTCEKLNAQIGLAKANEDIEKAKLLQIEHEVHVRKGDTFNESIKEMTALAKEDTDIAVVCMDFQKNLLLPVTGIGQEYYKRQLAVHNLGVHDCVSGNATMYVYPENFAGKGPNEVISCLEHYISKLPESIKQLVLFSDNCFSQNKNRYLTGFLQSLTNTRFREVNIMYPIPGHSRMPCDRDFAKIEKKIKKSDRRVCPSDLMSLIRNSVISAQWTIANVGYAFTDNLENDGSEVVKVKDIKKALDPIVKSVDGISSLRGISFQRGKPPVGRTSMAGAFNKELRFLKRGRSVKSLGEAIHKSEIVANNFLPLKKAKYDDIQDLIKHVHLPASVTFYSSLRHSEQGVSAEEELIQDE